MGVYLSGSTKIVDRATGEVFRGEVPAYSVVVPGSLPDPNGGPSLYCAVIVKRVDAQTRAKTGVNELLRDCLGGDANSLDLRRVAGRVQGEGRSLAGGRRHRDLAVHQGGQPLTNAEAQAGAAELAGG